MNKLFFTLLLLALAAYGQQQERVAIINTLDDRDSIGISELAYLTDKLRETAANVLPIERFGVMTTESIVAFLGSLENTVRVCKESSCLAELGRQVSADYVSQGRIGRFNDYLTIKVELYNVKSGNLMGSFAGSSKDISGLLALIEEKASDLFKRMLTEPKAPKPPEPSPEVVPVAPTTPQKPVDIAKIQALIKSNLKGLRKNKEQIQKESIGLSPKEIAALFEKNKMQSANLLGLLNGIGGLGLGSYIQGDITVGIIHSVIGAVSGALAIYTAINYNETGGYTCPNDKYPNFSTCEKEMEKQARKDEEQEEKATRKILIYGGIFAINWFASIYTPANYEKKYNKELKEALNDYSITVSFAPLIVPSNHPKNGTPAVGLAFNVRY
ncbi:MAG: hypothetical protein LBC75_03350 [Fibromonadaceae bacterium]|jgi:hypothetical protein|nr:hypothetical protein [Fibromonadaceae bacterium]